MGDLQLSGVATGIDTQSLIKQLMAVESRRLATYQLKQKETEQKNAAVDELRSLVSKLNSATSALSSVDSLQIYKASTNDSDVLSATADADASPGSHTVQINQLATSETWIQNISTFTEKTEFVGGGTFIYSYNNIEHTVTTVENETTLQDLVNLINNDSENPGVTASLVYQNDTYHLMLTGQETGEDYQITINSSNTQQLVASRQLNTDANGTLASASTKLSALYGFEGEMGSGSTLDRIQITGTRHDGSPVSVDFEINKYTTIDQVMNKITNAFKDGDPPQTTAIARFENGKIILTDTTSGTSQLQLGLELIPGTGSTASLQLPSFGQALEADLAFTSENKDARLTDKITTLDQFTFTTLGGSENITISGTNKDGSAAAVTQLNIDENTTIQDLIDQINSAFTGSTAYLVDGKIKLIDDTDGTSQTAIALTFDAGGSDASMELPTTFSNVSENVVGGTVDATLTSFDHASFIETQQAQNAQVKIDNFPQGEAKWIESNSNVITDALSGITLNLQDTTGEDTVKVTVTRNTSAVSQKVQAMVTAFNELLSYVQQSTEYSDQTKKMGLLSRDIAISLMKAQLPQSFYGAIPGFSDQLDSFTTAADLGISFEADGKMELDSGKLNDAIKEDFKGVLQLLSASAIGSSENNIIKFYSASESNTTAGEYQVEATVLAGEIVSARIRKVGETEWRNATWKDNMIMGDRTTSEGGDPIYPENGLNLTIDLDTDGTFSDTIRVKQGLGGKLKNYLDEMLKTEGGLDITKELVKSKMKSLDRSIEKEEARLEAYEERLKAKYARLEKTMALLQQQYSSVAMLSSGLMQA